MCQFSTKERKTGQKMIDEQRPLPALAFVVPSFRWRLELGRQKTSHSYASLFVQLPTSAVPDYRRFGRKVTFEPSQSSSPQNQPLSWWRHPAMYERSNGAL
jgi:hypothetical protein